MADPEHLAKIKEGVEAWNEWRENNAAFILDLGDADLIDADLRGRRLGRANLSGAFLINADLTGANLRCADLSWGSVTTARFDIRLSNYRRSNLINARLCKANLRESNLRGANLHRADLHEANLRSADLREADLSEADLSRADLSGAVLDRTILCDTDLSGTIGLETCLHRGPSSIGIDTFFLSGGDIPDNFLRGCGVPEHFITFSRSLVGQSIEFYSCFISYSSHDQVFAERLHADLRARNMRCWFAPEDLKIGDRFQETIEESIRLYDKVMIVMSEASVQSRWVEREVNAARDREDRENRTVLFPIRIDDAVMNASQPWAADIRRSRHIGDFRSWKNHGPYAKAFDRLLRDLKTEKNPMTIGPTD